MNVSKISFIYIPRLWPSHSSCRKRNNLHVNSASCKFFSPGPASELRPNPSALFVLSKESKSSTLQWWNTYIKYNKQREYISYILHRTFLLGARGPEIFLSCLFQILHELYGATSQNLLVDYMHCLAFLKSRVE